MPLRHTLLGLLDWKSMHGYRLRQYAKEYSWIYPMTNASIYPALHALEEEGFVTHSSEIHNGRARKVYAITEAGRLELRQWLQGESAASSSLRDQMLLKIAMQRDDTIGRSRHWIEAALEELEAEIEQHEKQVRSVDERAQFARLANEYGSEVLRLRKRFLERVLEQQRAAPAHHAEPASASLRAG